MLEVGKPIEFVLEAVFGSGRSRATGPKNFRELAALYIASPAFDTLRQRSREDCTNRLNVVCRAPWAGYPLARVTPDVLAAWSESLAARGPSGGMLSGPSINRYLSAVGATFRWATDSARRFVPTNPCRDVTRCAESPPRDVFLTPAEAAAFVRCCDDDVRPIVHFGLLTGIRIGALLALRWRAVDGNLVRVEPESDKAHDGYRVNLEPTALSVLAECRARRGTPTIDGSDVVFRRANGTALRRRVVGARMKVARARVAAVLTAAATDDDAKAAVERWNAKRDRVTFHALRHTAVTTAMEAGAPDYKVSRMAGHRSVRTTLRYSHATASTTKAPTESIAAVLGAAMITLDRALCGAAGGAEARNGVPAVAAAGA
jgi:integrase